MPYGITIGSVTIDSDFVDRIAEKAVDKVLSELPEEARTYDVAKYILKKASERLGSRTVDHKERCLNREE